MGTIVVFSHLPSPEDLSCNQSIFDRIVSVPGDHRNRTTPVMVKSDGVVFLPFVETSSVMASGTGTCLVL